MNGVASIQLGMKTYVSIVTNQNANVVIDIQLTMIISFNIVINQNTNADMRIKLGMKTHVSIAINQNVKVVYSFNYYNGKCRYCDKLKYECGYDNSFGNDNKCRYCGKSRIFIVSKHKHSEKALLSIHHDSCNQRTRDVRSLSSLWI